MPTPPIPMPDDAHLLRHRPARRHHHRRQHGRHQRHAHSTSSGSYNAVVTVSDGSLTDTDPFTWTVTDSEVALNFDGVNDYVSFGNAIGLGTATFTLEAWIRRDAAGAATSTGTGGVTAVPIVTKGRAEADGSNLDANYFLGIDANNHLVGDFEDAATGLNHPVIGTISIPVSAYNLARRAPAHTTAPTWRLYVDGVLDTTLAVGNFTPRADSIQHAGLGTAMTSTGLADGFFAGRMDEVGVRRVPRSSENSEKWKARLHRDPTIDWTGLPPVFRPAFGQGVSEAALREGDTQVLLESIPPAYILGVIELAASGKLHASMRPDRRRGETMASILWALAHRLRSERRDRPIVLRGREH